MSRHNHTHDPRTPGRGEPPPIVSASQQMLDELYEHVAQRRRAAFDTVDGPESADSSAEHLDESEEP